MFNRCCCSMRRGISRHRIVFPCIRRSFGTSKDSANSQDETSLQGSKESGKIIHKKESRSTTLKATTSEDLRPKNMRGNLFYNISLNFCLLFHYKPDVSYRKFDLQRNY